jgi:cell wall-associated NlpC family hydrolase
MPQAAESIEYPIIATRAQFVEACRSLLGVPWLHQGRSSAGVDCVGLITIPAIELGLLERENDVANYQRGPKGDRLDVLLHQHGVRLRNWKDAQPADILAIKYQSEPQHVMVVTRPWHPEWGFQVVHSFGSTELGGSVIEHRLDSVWLKSHRAKVHAAFRIRGIGD